MAEQRPEHKRSDESESGDTTLSRRVWSDIDASIRNLENGLVGDAFELDEVEDLLSEP